jgi:hypothetical protein
MLLLATFYFSSVAFLQNVLSAVSGQRSEIAIIISILVIAALFNRCDIACKMPSTIAFIGASMTCKKSWNDLV